MPLITLTARYSDGTEQASETFTTDNPANAILTASEWWTPMRGCTHAGIGWPFNPFATVKIDGVEVPAIALVYPDRFDALGPLVGFQADRKAA